MFGSRALLWWAAFIALCSPAFADGKLGFVVGINDYPKLGAEAQLSRAVADADAVGDALEGLGFKVTRVTRDITQDTLVEAFDEFTRAIQPGDTVVFYYAGHGITLDDGTYLVPSDVPLLGPRDERLAKRHVIPERDFTQGLRAAGASVAVVVVDACRDNPFPAKGTRSLGGTTRGLARIVPAEGVFSIYSAREGQTALDHLSHDDTDRNSVFTRIFLKQLKTPGLSLSEMGDAVRDEVAALARSDGYYQVPAVFNDAVGTQQIFLAGPAPKGSPIGDDRLTPKAARTVDVPPILEQPVAVPVHPHAIAQPDSSTFDPTDISRLLSGKRPTQTAMIPPAILLKQRAALLVDAPDEPQKVKTYVGSVVWRSDSVSAGQGQPLSTAVRADIEVPEAKLKVSFVLQKNPEPQLPASHTMELKFVLGPGNVLGGIKQINVPELRKDDEPTGLALAGVPVAITDNSFLVGLARGAAEAQNLQRIHERNWFDVSVLLVSGKVGKITFEKGITGGLIIDEAARSWQSSGQ